MSPDAETVSRAAALLAVMAHPARLRVLCVLDAEGECSAGDLQERLGVEASLLSHHLRQLKQARLVRVEARGRQRWYRLDDPHVSHVVRDVLVHVRE